MCDRGAGDDEFWTNPYGSSPPKIPCTAVAMTRGRVLACGVLLGMISWKKGGNMRRG
jgi:hypothetical protein